MSGLVGFFVKFFIAFMTALNLIDAGIDATEGRIGEFIVDVILGSIGLVLLATL